MNTARALQLAMKVAELTQLCTTFEAKYGRRYDFTPASPQDAQTLYRRMIAGQQAIAELLDPAALDNPRQPPCAWWRRHTAMDSASVGELAREVNRLIACCAYEEANPGPGAEESSYAVRASQEAIAGMLHPDVLRMTTGDLTMQTA